MTQVLSKSDPGYQQCTISVMDNIADPNIRFDEQGVCNYYHEYLRAEASTVLKGQAGQRRLEEMAAAIRAAGKGQQYDSILGISGGVDSTYMALLASKLGLRPLLVHFDNGWNSELAVSNITQIVQRLGFDLYTLVINWDEFRDLQLAYLKASVVDIEAITDHAIIGTMYRLAAEHGIKYILSGTNVVTEFVLPSYWIWSKEDERNIKAIHKAYGTVPLKTYPFYSARHRHYYTRVKGVQSVSLLNLVNYDKEKIKGAISEELGWRDYGGKHYESVFTRFYQGYILPTKFHIDKRKAHLSTLIFSGQMTRDEALRELNTPIYDSDLLRTDYDFVLKKFGLSRQEFEAIIQAPRREHAEFDHEKRSVWENYPWLKPARGIWKLLKRK